MTVQEERPGISFPTLVHTQQFRGAQAFPNLSPSASGISIGLSLESGGQKQVGQDGQGWRRPQHTRRQCWGPQEGPHSSAPHPLPHRTASESLANSASLSSEKPNKASTSPLLGGSRGCRGLLPSQSLCSPGLEGSSVMPGPSS